MFVGGKKLTSDLSRTIRLEASINACKWSSEKFDEVDWDLLDATLENKTRWL